jgi:hypothetical protein
MINSCTRLAYYSIPNMEAALSSEIQVLSTKQHGATLPNTMLFIAPEART